MSEGMISVSITLSYAESLLSQIQDSVAYTTGLEYLIYITLL